MDSDCGQPFDDYWLVHGPTAPKADVGTVPLSETSDEYDATETTSGAPFSALCDYCQRLIAAGDPIVRLADDRFACQICVRHGARE